LDKIHQIENDEVEKFMTKEELVSKLNAAVGDTAYGKELVKEAEETYGDADKKYGWNMKDRLDLRLAIIKAYAKKDAALGKAAKETAEEEKIAIVEKALAAIK
jgi:hypothetical protein